MLKHVWNEIECYCENKKYKSLYELSIEEEIEYSWLYMKLKKNGFGEIRIKGKRIKAVKKF